MHAASLHAKRGGERERGRARARRGGHAQVMPVQRALGHAAAGRLQLAQVLCKLQGRQRKKHCRCQTQ